MNYTITTLNAVLIVAVAVWELLWKGIALWKASKHDQKGWFIAILLINSVGILPIMYILLIREKDRHEGS